LQDICELGICENRSESIPEQKAAVTVALKIPRNPKYTKSMKQSFRPEQAGFAVTV
jgi:hypothetical protein